MNPETLAADENNPHATFGPEFDDTRRHILKEAMSIPADGRPIEERIREVADTRLSVQEIENIARGGKQIKVGHRVALRQSGIEHVYMRAKEEKSGTLFWALQSVRQVGLDQKSAKCDKSAPEKGCYSAAPTQADVTAFQKEILDEASDRLKRADKPFTPDENILTRIRTSMTDDGIYSMAEFEPLYAEVKYTADRKDTYESAFQPVSFPPYPDSPILSSGDHDTSYRELAASAILAVLFPSGIRLPKQMEGTKWLVRLTVPDDPRYVELDGGGESDVLRLKFLVETALNAAAVAILLSDVSSEDAEFMLARANITPFLQHPKAADAWAGAVKKRLSADIITKEARLLRERSPLLDHVADIISTQEDRKSDEQAEDVVKASKLSDWSGYRPLGRDIGAPLAGSIDISKVKRDKNKSEENQADKEETSYISIHPDLAKRMTTTLKTLGLPEKNVIRTEIESFIKTPNPDGVRAVRSGVMSAFSLLGKISTGMTSDADVATFKRMSKSDAKDILDRTSDMRKSFGYTVDNVVRTWLDLVDHSNSDIGWWMANSLTVRLKTSKTNVDILLARMEAAKEAIKNEKIEFFENAIDEDMQSTLAELRKLGLQTVDEQIIAYDAKQKEADREAGMGYDKPDAEDGDSYDTMAAYDDDDGLSYD